MQVVNIFANFIVITLLGGIASAAYGGDWTPLRLEVAGKIESHGKSICEFNKTKIIGLNIGLWQTGACSVSGMQVAPVVASDRFYGLQTGLLFALSETGSGLQIAGLMTQMGNDKLDSYVIQIAGVVNNPFFMYPPSINGIQIAPVGNSAGHLNGIQAGLVNMVAGGHAIQAGLSNIQVSAGNTDGQVMLQAGGYNVGGDVGGVQIGMVNKHGDKDAPAKVKLAQIGLYNSAREIKGFQLGIINRAVELTGFQIGLVNIISKQRLPFVPMLNMSW